MKTPFPSFQVPDHGVAPKPSAAAFLSITCRLLVLYILLFPGTVLSQGDIVTYAGGAGKDCFYDVMQLSDGTVLVCGYSEELGWIPAGVQRVQLSFNGNIPNALGSNRYGILLHLSGDLQSVLQVVHFPQGAVEDIRFMKTTSIPYSETGDLYISCNTADSDANNGGYLLAKLNANFITGVPTSLVWQQPVWAKSIVKENHPWDVTSDGRVYYVTGEPYAYDWCAVYCLDSTGSRMPVNHWRTHWLKSGGEWRGTPAASNPSGGLDSIDYSGIVLKAWGRCDFRSWTASEYNGFYPDGNGSFRKGRWPLDVLFNGPCDPASPTNNSPGYTGYSLSATPTYGGESIVVDRRTNEVYLGINFKSVLPGGIPDFEPAVVAMDSAGALRWWSRLYHEITPNGDTVNSEPDQYVDALAIDYANNKLVVGARCHGNNVENFWEGNTVAADPSAYGFQNNFTGSSGNIHISWLGKLSLSDGTLTHSTYMAELAEVTGLLGTPHPDPNLDAWPDPNTGWPDVNTTRMGRNNLEIASNGDVCITAVGRRTITTSNAYQRMAKPYYGGSSAWNSFVRVYDSRFHVPKYSSLVVGVWDTLTQAGGANTELFGICKTADGVIAVGRQTADTSGTPIGYPLPVANVPPWGSGSPTNESAILVYYKAANLLDPNDGPLLSGQQDESVTIDPVVVFPNPATSTLRLFFTDDTDRMEPWKYSIIDSFGRTINQGRLPDDEIDVNALTAGTYSLLLQGQKKTIRKRIIVNAR